MKQLSIKYWLVLITLCVSVGSGLSQAQEYEEIIYYHTDALGSPVLATKADGTQKWREEYAPYGSRLTKESQETDCSPLPCQLVESPWDEKQWFTGKLEETRVGLQYFGARWYDPEIGRFLSPDPVLYTQGNIYSFNRYAYANNNPYRYTDPNGQSPIDVVFLAVDVGRLAAAVYSGDTSAVQSAAVDVAFSAVGVVVPIPGAGQALKAVKAADKVASAASAASGTKSAVQSAEVIAKGVPGADGGFTADLTKSAAKSRSGHTNAGNKQLNDAMAGDPQLRADIEKRFGADAFDRTSTSGGGRRNPAGAEWDHNSSNPNKLDLRSSGNHRQKTSAEGQQGGGWKRFHRDKK